MDDLDLTVNKRTPVLPGVLAATGESPRLSLQRRAVLWLLDEGKANAGLSIIIHKMKNGQPAKHWPVSLAAR